MTRRLVVVGLRAAVVGEREFGNGFLLLLFLFLFLLGIGRRETGEDRTVILHGVPRDIVGVYRVEKHGMERNELEMSRGLELVLDDEALVGLGVVGIERRLKEGLVIGCALRSGAGFLGVPVPPFVELPDCWAMNRGERRRCTSV